MRSLIVIGLMLGSSMAAVAASDDYEIQASNNAPAHPVGQKLPIGSWITLPDGATIRFIDRTKSGSAVTRECGGKYDGSIEKCQPSPRRVPSTSPGATRGLAR